MTRLATALVLFAGGLSAVALGDRVDAATVTPAPSFKHRPELLEVSRSMRRLALPGQPRHASRRSPAHARRFGSRHLLTVTAYCYTGTRNAAGKWPAVGTAAANAFPLGTRLHVHGFGAVTVEDRSAPGATDVDLYLGSDPGCEQRAVAWGRRRLHVDVLLDESA